MRNKFKIKKMKNSSIIHPIWIFGGQGMYYLVRQTNATFIKRLYELTFLHTSHCNNVMNTISEGVFFQEPITLRD